MLKYFNNVFEGISEIKCLIITLVCALSLGFLDYITGPELSFSVFYIIPVMLSAWYGGKSVGMLLAVISCAIWLSADLLAGSDYVTFSIPFWNTLIRFTLFIIILQLLLVLREKLTLEEGLADTDALTGLANRRFFQEQLEREYARVRRYPEPFTIAYFDLDNFKVVNDTMGHDSGDELLKVVAEKLTTSIRKSDYAARLGGDEFAVLFPQLDNESAMVTLSNLQSELLNAMQDREWPVTFSIGAVTYTKMMTTSRDMIKKVDDLMYEVKKSGKNNIRHLAWP